MMRHASCWWFLGFGLKACTMSGNFMPSRMKKTWGGKEGAHKFEHKVLA